MYGFKIDHDTIIEDSETFELKVPIDEDTIILEDGKLKPNCTYQTGEYEYIYKTDFGVAFFLKE